MESVSTTRRLSDWISPAKGGGTFPCLDIEFDESAGSLRIFDPRLFQAGRRRFCERLLEAATRQPGIIKAEVALASASCQIEFSPGSQTALGVADSFACAVREAAAGSSLLERIWWWRGAGDGPGSRRFNFRQVSRSGRHSRFGPTRFGFAVEGSPVTGSCSLAWQTPWPPSRESRRAACRPGRTKSQSMSAGTVRSRTDCWRRSSKQWRVCRRPSCCGRRIAVWQYHFGKARASSPSPRPSGRAISATSHWQAAPSPSRWRVLSCRDSDGPFLTGDQVQAMHRGS